MVDVGWCFHIQCLMGSLRVEFLPPVLEPHRLFGYGCRRRGFNRPGNVPVHPFMTAVLLRMARHNALGLDPQTKPPGTEPGQSQWTGDRGKRAAIVATDDIRQTVTPE